MSQIENITLDRMCRGCLQNGNDKMYQLFSISDILIDGVNPYIHQMLTSSTLINVSENDGLPQNICSNCLKRLHISYTFKYMCTQSDVRLKAYLKEPDSACLYPLSNKSINDSDDKDGIILKDESSETIRIDKNIQTDSKFPQLFNCFDCQKNFRSLVGLKFHLKHHTGRDSHSCQRCGHLFLSEEKLVEHTRTGLCTPDTKRSHHAKENILHCESCKKTFLNNRCYKKHVCSIEEPIEERWENQKVKEELPPSSPVHSPIPIPKVSPPPSSAPSPIPSPPLSDEDMSLDFTDDIKKEIEDEDYQPLVVTSKKTGKSKIVLEIVENPSIPAEKYPCQLCPRVLSSEALLRVHTARHSGMTIPYTCHVCQKGYKRHSHLKRHLILHYPVKDEESGDDSEYEPLGVKIKRKHSEKKFPCNQCSRTLNSEALLKYHIAKHSGLTIPFTCNVCQKSFKRHSHLKRHMVVHSPSRFFDCPECDRKFTRKERLARHMCNHRGGEMKQCELCPRNFPLMEQLEQHLAKAHQDTIAHCTICKRSFCSQRSLERHMFRHSGSALTYSCKQCDQTFPSRRLLRKHNTMHRKQTRPFLCSQCGRKFARSTDLVIHTRRHLGVLPYQCRFCPKRFPRSTDHTTHERYHTEDKRHACEICGKTFHRQCTLKVHLRVHSGERPFACTHCEKSFTQSNDLKTHLRRHTGERFTCEICSEAFIQLYHLSRHKRNVHKLECPVNNHRVVKHPQTKMGRMPRQLHRTTREELS